MLITWVVVAAVVLVAAPALAVMQPRLRSRRLQRQFGSEYHRSVAQHEGNAKAAERDLEHRIRRAKEIEVRPLDAAARERFLAQWATLQEQFVDAPAKAVLDADALLTTLLRDLGYPDDDHYAALSVRHAQAREGYRSSRAAAERAQGGSASTEELREAFVRARETFDVLVRDDAAAEARTNRTNETTERTNR
ncbi:hypothetical protein ABIA33_003062 [Streptacidiphilus sp. MAP12-16]|uniref:hypothetical protein n=1 Tax=Streptacidiphilus sp. MAP12-16 TaxID=3156300 RepID=UPI003510EB42